MVLLIHDLPAGLASIGIENPPADWHVVAETAAFTSCIGCFDCWVKTPGQCILRDGFETLSATFAQCDTIVIISRCVYGSQSYFVKSVLDRSIGYVLPLFMVREGRMVHRRRYVKRLTLKMLFYGSDVTAEETITAQRLVKAQMRNLSVQDYSVSFFETLQALKAAI